jgi:hypothetical protein
MSHPPPPVRTDYRWFCAITTRGGTIPDFIRIKLEHIVMPG